MRAVDVRVHRREAVSKALGDKALRGQVVALRELVLTHNVENRWITFEARRMQCYVVKKVSNAREASLRIFESYASNEAVNLVIERQQKFGEVATVLPGDTGD